MSSLVSEDPLVVGGLKVRCRGDLPPYMKVADRQGASITPKSTSLKHKTVVPFSENHRDTMLLPIQAPLKATLNTKVL